MVSKSEFFTFTIYSVFLITAFFPFLLILSSYLLIEPSKEANNQENKENKENSIISISYGSIENERLEANGSIIPNKMEIKEDEIDAKEQFKLFIDFIKLPIIYRPVIFILLYMTTPSYSDPLFYFYTTELKFSPMIMGRLKLVYGCASVLGIYCFNKYLRNVSFKRIIWVTTILSIMFNMLTIIVVKRINVLIGIPDLAFCLFTDALTIVLAEINTMPLLVLACNLCPKNIEGTLYAFLMSVTNFGTLLSNQFGSTMSSVLGITNKNFDNLALLIFIANIILLFPMPFLNLVDDEAYISTKIEEEREIERENGNGNKNRNEVKFNQKDDKLEVKIKPINDFDYSHYSNNSLTLNKK